MPPSKRIRRISKRQEKVAAQEHGARQVPASGAVRFGGMDARNQGVCMLETKFTSAKQYTLKLEELEKLEVLAMPKCEIPVFQVGFEKGGRLKEYVILNKHDYLALMEELTQTKRSLHDFSLAVED